MKHKEWILNNNNEIGASMPETLQNNINKEQNINSKSASKNNLIVSSNYSIFNNIIK